MLINIDSAGHRCQSGTAARRAGGTPMPRIHLLDVTNRDGVQTARINLSKLGKTMVNFYLGKLGVTQSEVGFPFLFHEVPYIRANLALAKAGALGGLRLSGWARAVVADVEASLPLGLEHLNLSISTSDQMIRNKFRGRLDRDGVIQQMVAATRTAKAAGVATVGVNAEDGSRTDDAYLTEFALAAREAGADRVRYCDTIGGDSPGRIRERFASLAATVGVPVETHCHNDLGMAVANSVAGALGDLDGGQDAWAAREGRVVLTGEYGGKAGFRHVLDGLGIEPAAGDEDLVFRLVQLANASTGRPLTDDELPLLYPGHLS